LRICRRKRFGISNRAVIEFNGKPVQVIKEGWKTVVEKAGLATDNKERKVSAFWPLTGTAKRP
jgi:hypothetical protein